MHTFRFLCAIFFPVLGTPPVLSGAESRPNILFILADDLGWNALGCQGNKDVATPNLDRLAAQGMRFTRAYAEPQCSPTRAALLSGQWGARTGVHKVIAEKDPAHAPLVPAPAGELSPQVGNLAVTLQRVGYATGISGKWHVANNAFAAPLKKRPGYFAGYGFDYIGDCLARPEETDKSVNAITRDVMAFIALNRHRPFFAFAAHFSPHAPLQAPSALIDKYVARGFAKSSTAGGRFAEIPSADYCAMIEHLDAGVGRLLTHLDELGLAANTVVIFTSDNGGLNRVAHLAPKRMAKGAPYEGGIAVPLIVRWPGQVPAGRTCDIPTHPVDWYPTFAAMARGEVARNHRLDGESLLPLLTQTGTLRRNTLYWHVPSYTANYGRTPCSFLIQDDWKLIHYFGDFLDVSGQTPPDRNIPFGKLVLGPRTELYHLASDPSEARDLAAARPEKVQALKAVLETWWKDTGAKFPTPNPNYAAERWWTGPTDDAKGKTKSRKS